MKLAIDSAILCVFIRNKLHLLLWDFLVSMHRIEDLAPKKNLQNKINNVDLITGSTFVLLALGPINVL